MSLKIKKVFVNQQDKKGYQPTPEECVHIQRELAKKGINIQSSIQNFYKDGNITITEQNISKNLKIAPTKPNIQQQDTHIIKQTTLTPPTCKKIKLVLKDEQQELDVPLFLIPLTKRYSISEICLPHNNLSQAKNLTQIIGGELSEELVFRCGYDDCEKNLHALHSACLFMEFFYKLGWEIRHFLNDGISEPGIAIVGYLLENVENTKKPQSLKVYIHFKPEHAMTMGAYASIRIPTGYVHPASLLAFTLTKESRDMRSSAYYQFYFDYNYGGTDMIKIAFTQLNDVELDPFHDYLVEYIGRAITTPWTNKKLRLNIVNFLTSFPERFINFEKWMIKTYFEVGESKTAFELLEIIKNNIDHFIKNVLFEENLLVNREANKWTKISNLNDQKYKKVPKM